MMHFLTSVLFTGMFWIAQLRATLDPDQIPFIVWPDDKLDTLFLLAELATRLQLPTLCCDHYAVEVTTRSKNIDDLFRRLEIAIHCLKNSADSPSDWDPYEDIRLPRPVVEFSYSSKQGYRQPMDVLTILLEKIAILHYLIEEQSEDQRQLYYPYYLKEFGGVVDDTIDVIAASFEMN